MSVRQLPELYSTNKKYTKNIFRAEPQLFWVSFGSRLAIQGDHLYITAGERGKGMIAQDFTNIREALLE